MNNYSLLYSNWAALKDKNHSQLGRKVTPQIQENGIAFIIDNNQEFVLKQKHLKSKFIKTEEYQILNFLQRSYYKCHTLIKTISDDDYVKQGNHVYHLYKKEKGKILTIDDIIENPNFLKTIAKNLSKFQLIMANYKGDNLEEIQSKSNSKTIDLRSDLKNYVKEINNDKNEKLIQYIPLIETYISKLKEIENSEIPKLLIHRDFHIGNLIHHNGELILIDFDQMIYDYRIFDPAYLITTLFYKFLIKSNKIRKIPISSLIDYFSMFYQEYSNQISLTVKEKEYFFDFIQISLLAFVPYCYQNGWMEDLENHLVLISKLENNKNLFEKIMKY